MGQFENKALQAFAEKLDAQGVKLPLSEHTEVLAQPLAIGAHTMHNRIAVQPMEGCDGTADGRPAEPTVRRYMRFARGGAGLIWFEATAVCREGRANPRQLWLTPETLDDFRRLADQIREEAVKANGYAPLLILQATHSGRYSKPEGRPDPLIAYNNPLFEGGTPHPGGAHRPGRVPRPPGGADGRGCRAGREGRVRRRGHQELPPLSGSELLSAYTRPGRYGGSFENRTRFLRSAVQAAEQATGSDFIVTSRLNVYDGFPYPYGFGVAEGGGLTPDLSEPERLVSLLCAESGLKLLDVTIGNPYVNPHVNRPANHYPYACGESPPHGPGAHGVVRVGHPEVRAGSGRDRLRPLLSRCHGALSRRGRRGAGLLRRGGLRPRLLRIPGLPARHPAEGRRGRGPLLCGLRQVLRAHARRFDRRLRGERLCVLSSVL